ncbi:DoxX family protein [Flavobacterium sp. CYK-55]|uniref:BT_3928 family protein n=1 Tax=Flavobacterium sp. CYK-55 TaxID=2835529 RepID=UPI001BCD7CEB|nr:BT_3928 family protein [Flavobacterium sp. CYK-55]MBS7788139.1 DoxX family protein [Flavobacterium sp. CYK-55]
MKKFLVHFSRIFVGLLFIISGLIKLNDPVGFSYKLSEYFSETVLNLPVFVPYSLAIALFVVIFETALGIMLLLGFKNKFTVWSLLLMIVFFTFLTFYSAYFNKVTDCGCFGDALKLTPWQSFTKDVVLLFFILILFLNIKLIQPLFNHNFRNALVSLSVVLCCFMGYWVLNHLPLKDFRAYKVGTNIQKAMEIPEGTPKTEVEMIFVYNVNGVKKNFTENDLMSLPANAQFVERIDKVISEGYKPPVHDFTMELDGSDYKDELLVEPKLLLYVMYDLNKADKKGLEQLEGLTKKAKTAGYKVIAMTASNADEIAAVKKEFGYSFDFYFCDGTTLKTIERANPSIVVMHQGTIKQKVHYNDISTLKL